MKVHIIVTCFNPALVDASLLVFKTIRVGFPTAEIIVYGNELSPNVLAQMPFPVRTIQSRISHDHWIETLIHNQHEPFWIVDTDVVFFDSVEHFQAPMFGGRFEPEFRDDWTRSTHVACLHPSLMYFDPVAIRCALFQWRLEHIPKYFPNVISNLIRQQMTVRNGETIFHDTCSGLHHAFGGTAFDEDMNKRFEHLHCGAVSDAIAKDVAELKDLEHIHHAVCANPELAKGLMTQQMAYYASKSTHGT